MPAMSPISAWVVGDHRKRDRLDGVSDRPLTGPESPCEPHVRDILDRSEGTAEVTRFGLQVGDQCKRSSLEERVAGLLRTAWASFGRSRRVAA